MKARKIITDNPVQMRNIMREVERDYLHQGPKTKYIKKKEKGKEKTNRKDKG